MIATNLKESDYIKPWAIFFALAFVGGTVAGAIVGAVIGGILGALGFSAKVITVFCGGMGFLVSMPISYFSFRFAVARFLLPKITAPEPVVTSFKAAA